MSLEYLQAVYNLPRNMTSASEQAVLAALAFSRNKEDGRCFPAQQTIANMTHMSRQTVNVCLNALRDRGLIIWEKGGFTGKRRKDGKPLANSYKINASVLDFKKQSEKSTGNEQDMHKAAPDNITVSATPKQQCKTERHDSVNHAYTAVSTTPTPTEIDNLNINRIPNRNGAGSESGFGFAIGDVEAKLLKDVWGSPAPSQEERQRIQRQNTREALPVSEALSACDLTPDMKEYGANEASFRKMMLKVGMERSMDIVFQFESEKRQGEMSGVRNLAALLMSRLKAALPQN